MTQSIFDQAEYAAMLQQIATPVSVLRMKAENCRYLATTTFIDDVISRIDPAIVERQGRDHLEMQLAAQLEGIGKRMDRLAEVINDAGDIGAQAQSVMASISLEVPEGNRARYEAGQMTLMEYILLVPQCVVPRLTVPES